MKYNWKVVLQSNRHKSWSAIYVAETITEVITWTKHVINQASYDSNYQIKSIKRMPLS